MLFTKKDPKRPLVFIQTKINLPSYEKWSNVQIIYLYYYYTRTNNCKKNSIYIYERSIFLFIT